MTRVGFIGLGSMGATMALRLSRAGFELRIWNRSAGKGEDLVAAGASECGSVAEVFEQSDIVFSMLSNDAANDSAFSVDSLAKARGTLHVNMSTMSLEMCRLLEKRHKESGVGYVAAPVLGRPNVAAAGQLNIVAAGPDTLLDQAEPVLLHLGKKVWRVGTRPEQANLVKIGVNYNLIHALQALGESISLVEHGGVDSKSFVEILTDAAFTGSAYVGYGALIAQREYRPASFTVELGMKDLSLAVAASEELGAVLPTAPVMQEIFTEAINDPELTGGDWSIIAEVIRRGPAQQQWLQNNHHPL